MFVCLSIRLSVCPTVFPSTTTTTTSIIIDLKVKMFTFPPSIHSKIGRCISHLSVRLSVRLSIVFDDVLVSSGST